MSGSVNKVILVGNIGKDPEVRAMSNGDRVCNLSVATSERWKKDGQKQEKTEWHRVVIFDQKIIDVAEKYLAKGAKVYLEGQLQTRKWTDQQGVEKYSTEVVLQRFRGTLTMLGDKAQSDAAPYEPPSTAPATAPGGYGNRQEQSDLDDEIVF